MAETTVFGRVTRAGENPRKPRQDDCYLGPKGKYCPNCSEHLGNDGALMFVPKVAAAQTKATESPTRKLLSQPSAGVGRPFSGGAVQEARVLQPSIGNQATLRVLAERASAPRVVAWDFSKIPLFPPDRTSRSQASCSLLGTIQPKTIVGEVDDLLEHQADRIADQLMRMPALDRPMNEAPPQFSRQRVCGGGCPKCTEEQSDHEPMQIKRAGTPEAAASEAPGIVHDVLRTPGQSLDSGTRAYFEPRLRYDFGSIRIHSDAKAAESARSMNALAYTAGNHVVFGAGQFAPQTHEGRWLLTHELVHTVQQGQAQPRIQRLKVKQNRLKKGTCGEYDVEWNFRLSEGAPGPGYMVQQVDISEITTPCPGPAVGPPSPILTYWEAWAINRKGLFMPRERVKGLIGSQPMHYTDGSTRPPRPDTTGSYISTGTIKFFLRTTTGDLGADWGRVNVTIGGETYSANDMPATLDKPSWWDSSPVEPVEGEGPAKREVQAWWNCCDDLSKDSFASAKPEQSFVLIATHTP